jgi:hypothetical protein
VARTHEMQVSAGSCAGKSVSVIRKKLRVVLLFEPRILVLVLVEIWPGAGQKSGNPLVTFWEKF